MKRLSSLRLGPKFLPALQPEEARNTIPELLTMIHIRLLVFPETYGAEARSNLLVWHHRVPPRLQRSPQIGPPAVVMADSQYDILGPHAMAQELQLVLV